MSHKEQTACFTGHRNIKQSDIKPLEKKLEKLLEKLIGEGIVYFGCGGAVGFDFLSGFTVLRLRERYNHIKLIMVLPCRNQDAKWTAEQKRDYKRLLDAADKAVCLSEAYYDGYMLARNSHLIQHSAVCVAYLTNTVRSGTAQTVRLARENNLTVYNLADL